MISIFFFYYRLSAYLPHNRNNLRVRDLDGLIKHMKNGRLPVVSFLSELPATEHDPRSFAVDLTLFTVNTVFFFFQISFVIHFKFFFCSHKLFN